MTTEQLIEACSDEGVIVSATQLSRWVREGLIPASLRRQHGRGRGMGVEWRWEPECLPRAVLIASTLATGDPSFQRAARALAEAGYAPAVPRLRAVFLDYLAEYQRLMTKRQTYLIKNHPRAEKRKRLTKHMRRKMPTLPDSAFQPFAAYIGALLDVIPSDDAGIPVAMKWLQQYFSIPALQHRLETIDGSLLQEKYEEANHATPFLMPLLVEFINWFLPPLYKQQLEKEGRDTSALPTSINPEEILENAQLVGSVRSFYAIFLIALPTEYAAFLNMLDRMLQDIFPLLFSQVGIPPELTANFLESMDASSVQSQPQT